MRDDGRPAPCHRGRRHCARRCARRARRIDWRDKARPHDRGSDHPLRFYRRRGRGRRVRGAGLQTCARRRSPQPHRTWRMSDDIPFRDAVRVWARIALMSFGGPAGQIAVMHRELVEERKWIDEPQFLHALNFCMLLPGPEAQQLATYIGWLKNGVKGGIVAGGLFILPGVVAIMTLSIVYATWDATPLLTGLFFGLKAAVLAIVLDAVIRIGRRALQSPAKKTIAAAAFVAIFFFAVPFPLIVLEAAVGGFLAFANVNADPPGRIPERRRSLWVPALFAFLWLAPVAGLTLTLGSNNVFTQIALFFSRMAVVTFGGAYAVLAYVAQEAVGHFRWLTAREMLDGLGM